MFSTTPNNRSASVGDAEKNKGSSRSSLKWIVVCVFAVDALFLVGLFVGWVLLTPSGGRWLVKTVVEATLDPESFEMGTVQGSLLKSFDMSDIVFAGQNILPEGGKLVIKRLRLDGDLINWRESQFRIEQGRLFLPSSDPILFEAVLQDGVWEAFVYGRRVDLEDLLGWSGFSHAAEGAVKTDVQGSLNDLDVKLKGPWEALEMEIEALVQLVSSDPPMSLNEAGLRGQCSFSFKDPTTVQRARCRAMFDQGRLKVRHLSFDIMPSHIDYDSLSQKVDLSLQARALAAGHKIFVTITGSPDQPQLGLSSEPPKSRAQILSLLALGGAFEDSKDGGQERRFAVDITRLFLLGSRGEAFFNKLGLSSATVEWSQNGRGLVLERRVGSRADLKYKLEQQRTVTSPQAVQTQSSHQIGAEVDLGKGVAVEIKQRRPLLSDETQNDHERSEGEVLLKFKKSF